DSAEHLLIADNRISCPGDKVGDGEAIAFDGSGRVYGYARPAEIAAATGDSATVSGDVQAQPKEWGGPAESYYVGFWVQVVAGPGIGQTRRIVSYHSTGA